MISDLRQVNGFLRVLLFPPPICNSNIVKSAVKHHSNNSNPYDTFACYFVNISGDLSTPQIHSIPVQQ